MKQREPCKREILLAAFAAIWTIGPCSLPARSQGNGTADLKWGSLTVITIPAPVNGGPDAKAHLKILDKAGKVLADLSDAMVTGTALRDIDGLGLPELEVNLYTGGLHCCFTNMVFTQDGGFRRLIDLPGGQVDGIAGVKNLDGKGRPEIIVYDNNTWAYYADLSYAVSPSMPLIIGWNGSKYINQTLRFPQRTLASAKQYQSTFLETLKRSPKDDDPGMRQELRHAATLGYYANMLAIGRGREAKIWLLKHASSETRDWLNEHGSEIRRTMTAWSRAEYTPKG